MGMGLNSGPMEPDMRETTKMEKNTEEASFSGQMGLSTREILL